MLNWNPLNLLLRWLCDEFQIEIPVPFLFFIPGPVRIAAALATMVRSITVVIAYCLYH